MNTIISISVTLMSYFLLLGCLTVVIMILLDIVNAASTNINYKLAPLIKRVFNINISDKVSKIIIFIIGIIIAPIYVPAELYMNSRSRKRFVDKLNIKDE